jgi:hypothetical protein
VTYEEERGRKRMISSALTFEDDTMSSHSGSEEFQEDSGELASGDVNWAILTPHRTSQ